MKDGKFEIGDRVRLREGDKDQIGVVRQIIDRGTEFVMVDWPAAPNAGFYPHTDLKLLRRAECD